MNDLIFKHVELFDPNSKLWIFQSLTALKEKEKEIISFNIERFLKSWNSHGNEIKSTSLIIDSHFIFVFVDSNLLSASGCSIDKLFNKIKELGVILNKNLINNNLIAFRKKSSDLVEFLTFIDLKNKIRKKNIEDNIIIYDNSITVLHELKYWRKSLLDWKKKYIKN